jgi:hypothetical protein
VSSILCEIPEKVRFRDSCPIYTAFIPPEAGQRR